MHRIVMKKSNFKDVGWTLLIYETCPSCGKTGVNYPEKWRCGVACPYCDKALPGGMLLHTRFARKNYHKGVINSSIGNILLCTK